MKVQIGLSSVFPLAEVAAEVIGPLGVEQLDVFGHGPLTTESLKNELNFV